MPFVLHTPTGLALIELQGTINYPEDTIQGPDTSVEVGRLVFPDYNENDPSLKDNGEGKWMKRVWLFIGEHQRLTGEVKKLSKPIGVLRRKETTGDDHRMAGSQDQEALEFDEIVYYKIIFSSRPEPVGMV